MPSFFGKFSHKIHVTFKNIKKLKVTKKDF